MKLFGFQITRVKAAVDAMSVANSGGAFGGGWFGVIRESFAGAFQSVIEVDTPRNILAFSGVFSPLTLIATDVSKMRIKLIVENDDGICTEIKKGSPFLNVLRTPNHYQNRIQFLEQWIISKLLYGNTYVLKQRDNRGIVTALYILDTQRVTPLVATNGDVYYRLSADHLSGLLGSVTVPASEIIHDRMNCLWHPLVGISPIYACGMSATMGNKIQANSATFFQNMSRPSGMLTAPGTISGETAARLKSEWEQNFSGSKIGRLAVLGDDMKYEAMTIPAEQSQLIEQLKWTVEDVARCFHMPLFKVGGQTPANNTIEQLNLLYYSDCLQGLIESAELCLDEGLALPNNYGIELDLDSLARMDTLAQVTTLNESVKGGWMSPNEARAKRNMKPVAGGNSPMAQQQNFSLEALAKRDALPNPFVLDKPTSNPSPSSAGPAPIADPNSDAQSAAKTAELIEYISKGLACST